MSAAVPHVQVRVGPQGRVVIPAELRHRLGLEPGRVLVGYIDGPRLVLVPPEELLDELEDMFADMSGGMAAELIEERREEARRELEE